MTHKWFKKWWMNDPANEPKPLADDEKPVHTAVVIMSPNDYPARLLLIHRYEDGSCAFDYREHYGTGTDNRMSHHHVMRVPDSVRQEILCALGD